MGNCQTISEDGEKRISTKFGGKPQVYIKTLTWARDSHGLFDYESKNLTKKNLKATHSGKVMRQGNEIRIAKENEKHVNKEEKELFKLMIKEGNVLVDNLNEPKEKPTAFRGEENLENVDYDLWLVVKSLKTHASNKGYKLTEGDLIKLGRVKFRIRELKGSASKASKCEKQTKIEDDNISLGESDKKSCGTPKGSQASVAQTCRICLSESIEPGDPFFSPCNCTGTMKYIHVKCLQRWLKSKLHTKQSTSSTSVYWKTLECELCKTQYPTYFIVDEKRYDVVEFDRPECPYIILDILSKDKCITRGIHVIKMENKTNIRLGRGHDSDIRITDISVSRCHAFIKLEKGEFFIDDNNSKFGTLVHLRKAFTIPIDVPDVSLQVGRTVVALTVKKGRKFLSSCFSSTTENHNTSNDERNSESEEGNDSDHLAHNDGDQSPNSPNSRNAASRPQSNRLQQAVTIANASSMRARGNPGVEDEHEEEEGDSFEHDEPEDQPVVEDGNVNANPNANNNANNNAGNGNANQQEINANNIVINLAQAEGSQAVQGSIPNNVPVIHAAPVENQPAQADEPVNEAGDNFNDCDGPVD